MRRKNLLPSLLTCLLLVLCHALANGQTPDIVAFPNGRPSVNPGTDLVEAGVVQIESGFSWTRDQNSQTFDGPESLVRLRLSNRTELQIGMPDLNEPGTGFDDLSVGAKIKVLSDQRPWPLAIVGSLSFPTGSPDLTSGAIDPALLLSVSHNLAHDFQLSGSLTLASVSAIGAGRSLSSQLAIDVGRCLSQSVCLFLEGAPFLGSGDDTSGITADAGMTMKIARTLPFDWRVGATIQDGGPTVFISVGYSVRRIPRRERLITSATAAEPPHRAPEAPRINSLAPYTTEPTITTADAATISR